MERNAAQRNKNPSEELKQGLPIGTAQVNIYLYIYIIYIPTYIILNFIVNLTKHNIHIVWFSFLYPLEIYINNQVFFQQIVCFSKNLLSELEYYVIAAFISGERHSYLRKENVFASWKENVKCNN